MSSRPSLATLCCALLLMTGTAGLVAHLSAGHGGIPTRPGQGAFWRLVDRDDRLVAVPVPTDGLHLEPGQRLAMADPLEVTSDDLGLRSVELTLRRAGRQSSSLDLSFREQAGAAYHLKVVPGNPVVAFLSRTQAGGRSVELARAERNGWMPNEDAPFVLGLRLDGGQIHVTLDGAQLLLVSDETLSEGRTSLWTDGIDVLAASAAFQPAVAPGAQGPMPLITLSDDFATFAAPAENTDLFSGVLGLALALLLSCGWLASLCHVSPPPGKLFEAALKLLALPGFVLTVSLFRDVSSIALGVMVGLSAVVGLIPALLHLRTSLGGTIDDELSDGAGPGAWLRVGAVVVGLGLWAVLTAGYTRADSMAPVQLRQERSLVGLSDAEFHLDAPLVLDISNALTVPGPYHGTVLETSFTLEPNSLLEIRLRSQERVAEGVALLLSSDERVASGWRVERDATFGLLGSPAPVLQPHRSYRLSIKATDNRFSARLDDSRFASAMEPDAPSGSVILLSPAGQARLDSLSVIPSSRLPAPLDIKAQGLRAAITPFLSLLMLMVMGTHVMRRPFLRIAEPLAYAWVPIALACSQAEPAGHLSWTVWLAGATATLPLLIVPALLLPSAVSKRRRLIFLAVAIVAGPGALTATLGPPERADRAAGPSYEDFGGFRLNAGLTHYEHPLVRRFNGWLRDHSFRGQHIPLDRPANTQRVLCIGSSSTWGHGLPPDSGLDWPAQLQRRMKADGLVGPVQVINGAIRGTTSGRMLFFLEEVLLQWRPDVIIVDFGYNDSGSLSIADDRAWLQQFAEDDYDHGPLRKLDTWWQRTRGESLLAQLWRAEHTVDSETAKSWKHLAAGLQRLSPAAAFERNLRTMGQLAESIGAEMILVKEPLRDDGKQIWKKEFSRVMDRVGRELHVPVIDPGPTMAATGGASLFMDFVHLLPAGHRALARIIEPELTRVLQDRQ
ncbi:MAG: lysophospholipase L1-like esterase [Pseudohongiellaceae bacterium]|jgi:lysophospholipase L1-like esterase